MKTHYLLKTNQGLFTVWSCSTKLARRLAPVDLYAVGEYDRMNVFGWIFEIEKLFTYIMTRVSHKVPQWLVQTMQSPGIYLLRMVFRLRGWCRRRGLVPGGRGDTRPLSVTQSKPRLDPYLYYREIGGPLSSRRYREGAKLKHGAAHLYKKRSEMFLSLVIILLDLWIIKRSPDAIPSLKIDQCVFWETVKSIHSLLT